MTSSTRLRAPLTTHIVAAIITLLLALAIQGLVARDGQAAITKPYGDMCADGESVSYVPPQMYYKCKVYYDYIGAAQVRCGTGYYIYSYRVYSGYRASYVPDYNKTTWKVLDFGQYLGIATSCKML